MVASAGKPESHVLESHVSIRPDNGGESSAMNGKTVSLDFVSASPHPLDMKFILTTHNVTLTKAIEDHVLVRIEKLEHFDRWAVDARVTLEHDNTRKPERQFKCSIRLGVRGPDLYAEDHDGDLYAAIDKVTKKIEQQIRKRHNKNKARKHTEAAAIKRRRQDANI
jgi:putative sigma-54 modulation protein